MERWGATPSAADHTGTTLRPAFAGQRGSTFIELLSSTLFVSILMAISYSFARAALMTARVQEVKSEAQEATVMTLDILTREIRLAGFSAGTSPITAIRTAGREQVEVATDFNGDGDSDDTNELIAYSYDSIKRQLMRATGSSPQPFVRNVPPGGVRFSFFDTAGNEIPSGAGTLTLDDRRRIHRIDVVLDVEFPNPDPLATAPLVSTRSTSVSLSNQ